jgi:hypothetical protein
MTFVVDGLSRLLAWIGQSPAAAFVFLDAIMEEDLADLASLSDGLPHDVGRVGLLLTGVLALVVTQVLVTRGLPPGDIAMETAIVNGLPWPGRWRKVAAAARAVRPWAITAVGIGATAWILVALRPLSGEDWSHLPLILIGAELGVWGAAAFSGMPAVALTNRLPSYVDVSIETLNEAERAVEEADRAEALRRWPPKRELRLPAAVAVFAAPPPPLRCRKERTREAWWAGTTTSVEALATELVLQALVQARDMGLVTITQSGRRNPRVNATLPPDGQPHGLARLVAGCHREGMTPGREVSGTLTGMLAEASAIDQYAIVIGIALEDLAAAGVASPSPEGWQLSAKRLNAVSSQLATASAIGGQLPTVTPVENLAVLRRQVFGHLRKKQITDGGDGAGILGLLSFLERRGAERRERSGYQLPVAVEED